MHSNINLAKISWKYSNKVTGVLNNEFELFFTKTSANFGNIWRNK